MADPRKSKLGGRANGNIAGLAKSLLPKLWALGPGSNLWGAEARLSLRDLLVSGYQVCPHDVPIVVPNGGFPTPGFQASSEVLVCKDP